MLEQNDSTPDGASVSSDRHKRSSPAGAQREAPSVFALLAATACTVLGAKLVVISVFGSRMPLMDQWDAEAAGLYSPYLRGTLSFADLFARHNEHRIFITRVLGLVHLELAGEWDTRLEMILDALVHVSAITWLLLLLMPLVAPQRRMLLACFGALVFAVPIAYENTLWGFQSQVYFALLFGIAALVAFVNARPFSLRWFAGLFAAVLSYFSYATGVAAILSAGIVVVFQLATGGRTRQVRDVIAVVAMAAVAVALIVWEVLSTKTTTTHPRTFLLGLFLLAALAIAGAAPALWLCLHILGRRPVVSDRAWLAVAVVGWIAIQLVLLAYGRGISVAPRYMDFLLLIYPVGLVAVLKLVDRVRATRYSRYTVVGASAWVFAVGAAIAVIGYYSCAIGAVDWGKKAREQMDNAQSYLSTKNVERLTSGHDQPADLSYPNPKRLGDILMDPEIQAVLPPELRPADADTSAAHNRLLLRGRLAGVTATSTHLALSMGPFLLALGIALFFAVAGRRGLAALGRTPITATTGAPGNLMS